MRRISLCSMILLFTWSILQGFIAYFPNDLDPEVTDARGEALGRTSILSSSGANYIFNNPAMLGFLSQKNFQFNGRIKKGKREDQFTGSEEGTDEYKMPLHFKINGISYAMPFEIFENQAIKTAVGIGYRNFYDFSIKEHYEDKEMGYESDWTYAGGYNTLVMGGGISYLDKISGGITMSIPFMSSLTAKYSNTDEAYSETESRLGGEFYTISASCQANSIFKLGLRIRGKIKLSEKSEDDEGIIDKTYYIIPPEHGLAIEVKPNEELVIYAEYLTRRLGDYGYLDGNYHHFLYDLSDNGFSFRTGLEYGNEFKFRGGLFGQSVPKYKVVDGAYEQSPQTEIGLTTGLGIKMGTGLTFNIYGNYSILNYEEDRNTLIGQERYTVEYSYSMLKVGFSLGGSFK
ncbi:MAG: hypothetical protein K9M99_02800 [Candidatus Cloacimonetes bacterium]|nr:hypothetical protein [Candidatus Cloacimonadota bacterium]